MCRYCHPWQKEDVFDVGLEIGNKARMASESLKEMEKQILAYWKVAPDERLSEIGAFHKKVLGIRKKLNKEYMGFLTGGSD